MQFLVCNAAANYRINSGFAH